MGEGVLYTPRSGCSHPDSMRLLKTSDLYRCISRFNDLRLRRLIKDSLSFTCPIFPLPGYIVRLNASLGVTLRFTPHRYQ